MNPELEQLLNNLTSQEKSIEQAIAEYQGKLETVRAQRIAVETTRSLLKNEPMALPMATSSRYAKTEMTEAIRDCVNGFSGPDGLGRAEIAKLLKQNGFTYNGKPQNFYPSVSMALTRLAKSRRVVAIKGNGAIRFAPATQSISPEITGVANGAVRGGGHHS